MSKIKLVGNEAIGISCGLKTILNSDEMQRLQEVTLKDPKLDEYFSNMMLDLARLVSDFESLSHKLN